MINWPENLVRDIARRSAVIVIGSGVSKHAVSQQDRRPPVWKEFLLSALEQAPQGDTEHIKDAIRTGDLLHACEWLKKRSDENWTPFLRREFRDPIYHAGDIHRVIVELDASVRHLT